MLPHVFQFHTQQYHSGCVNLDIVEVFTLHKSANSTNQSLPFSSMSWVLTIYQYTSYIMARYGYKFIYIYIIHKLHIYRNSAIYKQQEK